MVTHWDAAMTTEKLELRLGRDLRQAADRASSPQAVALLS
jgi:hypothetical protein